MQTRCGQCFEKKFSHMDESSVVSVDLRASEQSLFTSMDVLCNIRQRKGNKLFCSKTEVLVNSGDN